MPKSLSKTPAPKKDRIFGSDKNKKGSASSKASAKGINLNDSIIETLSNKAKEYNEKHPNKRVSVASLKAVMRRGMGAYSTSYRPTITGGAPNSRQAWGFARVNKFLKKKAGQQVKAAYVQDDDLMAKGGVLSDSQKNAIEFLSKPNTYAWSNNIGGATIYSLQEGIPMRGGKTQNIKAQVFNSLLDKNYLESVDKGSLGIQERIAIYKLNKNDLLEKGGFIAPNGKTSNLTPEQYKLVRTPEFKAWFGDWENDPKNASKVVDENGEPKVVYHGSRYGGINIFDYNQSLRESSGLKEYGNFFTDNTWVAELYRNSGKYTKEVDAQRIKEISKLESLLENVRTNREYDLINKEIDKWYSKTYEVFLNLRKVKEFDAEFGANVSGYQKLEVDAGYKIATGGDAISFLKEGRFGVEKVDGIIAHNIVEMMQKTSDWEQYIGTSYLVFEPQNIKLADGTNKTFDMNNPDIRYADGGEVKEYKIDGKDATFAEFKELYNRESGEFRDFDLNPKKVEYFGNNEQTIRYVNEYSYIISPFMKDGSLKDNYMKAKVKETYNNVPFRVFASSFRKHIDPSFKASNRELKKGRTFNDVASYIISDGGYYIDESKYRAFAKDFNIEIPTNDSYAEVGLTEIAKDVYISKDKDKLPKDATIVIHRYNDDIKAGDLGLFAGYSEGMEFDDGYGKNKVYISIGKNAKVKKVVSTERYLRNLGEFDTPREDIQEKYGYNSLEDLMDDAGSLDNPSDAWYETQKVAISKMRESGEDFDVLEMTYEEDYIPHQYLITTLKNSKIKFKDGGQIYADGGQTGQAITCVNCGWHWNTADSDEFDKYVCHKCGFDNRTFYSPDPIGVMADGGVLGVPSTENLIELVRKERENKIREWNRLGYRVVVGRNDGYYYNKKSERDTEFIDAKNPSERKITDIIKNNPDISEIGFNGTIKAGKRVGEELEIADDFSVVLWKKDDSFFKEGLKFEFVQDGGKYINIIVNKNDTITYKDRQDDGKYVYFKQLDVKYNTESESRSKKELLKEEFDNNEAIFIKDKYADGGLIAPNGKPSNLTPEQYKLVRTSEFKAWFGDWENDPENSSKVVDENGEPLVVYRGMPKKRRVGNVFRYNVNLWGTKGLGGRQTNKFAFYFTDIKEVAKGYVEDITEEEGGYVIKSYFLNIRKLFKAFSKKNQYETTFKELYDLANTSGEPIYYKDYRGNIETDYKGNKLEVWNHDWHWERKYKDKFRTQEATFSFFVDWNKEQSNQYFWRVYFEDYLKYNGLVFYETTNNGIREKLGDELTPEFGDEFSKTYGVFEPNQIKIADGTNTTFDATNPDIRYADGGATDYGKVVSASSRFRPMETIVFDPPLVGLNGAKLISYTWSFEFETSFSKREGEAISVRKSDWTNAEISAETGRDIVHKYTIEMPNGDLKVVSSDSVPVLLGYTERAQKSSFPNLSNAAKTLAKQKLQLSILEAKQKEKADAISEIIAKGIPEVRVEEGGFRGYRFIIGDSVCHGGDDPNDKERLECPKDGYIRNRLKEMGIDPYGHYSTYELKNRIERQERKIKEILNSKTTAEMGLELPSQHDLIKMELGLELFKPSKTIEQIAKEKDVPLDYAEEQLRKGIKTESEHSDNQMVQETIALQHLDEMIDYYDKLDYIESQNKMEKGGVTKFYKEYLSWYKDGVFEDMTIMVSVPNSFSKMSIGENDLILDVFEKKDENIDAKKKLTELLKIVDRNELDVYLEPIPRLYNIKDKAKREKITREYLIKYYEKFGFELLPNGFMVRKHNKMEKGGVVPNEVKENPIYKLLVEKSKQDSFTKQRVKMPSLDKIGGLLGDIGIDVHSTKESKDYLKAGQFYTLIYGNEGEEPRKRVAYHIDITRVDSYYSRNTPYYAKDILKYIDDFYKNNEMEKGGYYKAGGEINPDNKSVKDYFSHGSGNAGGVLVGKRHSEGGIKAVNKSTNQPLEMEGGEVVITRNAVSDNTKREFNGEMLTNREILSKINESGGGVSFADGGDIPETISTSGKEYKYGGKMMKDHEIVSSCGCNHSMAEGGKVKGKLSAELIHIENAIEYYKNDSLINPTKEQKLNWEIFGLPDGIEKIEQKFETTIDEFYGNTKKDIENQYNEKLSSGYYDYLGLNPQIILKYNNKMAEGGETDYHNDIKNHLFPKVEIEIEVEVEPEMEEMPIHEHYVTADDLGLSEGMPMLAVGTIIYSSGGNDQWEVVSFSDDGVNLVNNPKSPLQSKMEDKHLTFDELMKYYKDKSISIKNISTERELEPAIALVKSKLPQKSFALGGFIDGDEDEDAKIMQQQFGKSNFK